MKKDEMSKVLDSENEELEKERNVDRRRRILYFIFFLVLLFFSTFGITYSIYKGDSSDDNVIETDKIIFSYSDVDKSGSGINITNAIPTSDARGKTMTGKGQYFDFSITATSNNHDIVYKVLARKNDVSSLSNNKVRIYLTKLSGSFEEEILLDTFSNLKQEVINGTKYYVLYEKTLPKGINNYSDYYRLRMWVKEDAADFSNQVFSINVDVQAVQGGK